jgi:phosphodiesterase/alkaline phosphatase D-like protein
LSFPFENRPLAPRRDRADGANGKAYHAAGPFSLGVASGDPTHESIVLSPVVATELVGTSISSDFAPEAIGAIQAALQHSSNGHIKFFDGVSRGCVRCDGDQERWRADCRAVATVLEPTSLVQTLSSFEIRDGVPGAVAA